LDNGGVVEVKVGKALSIGRDFEATPPVVVVLLSTVGEVADLLCCHRGNAG
jgi:hypothetical protein